MVECIDERVEDDQRERRARSLSSSTSPSSSTWEAEVDAEGEEGWVNGTSKNSAWQECAEMGSTRRASGLGTQSESEEIGETGDVGNGDVGKGEAGNPDDNGEGAPKTANSSTKSSATLSTPGSTKLLKLSTSSSP